MDSISCNNCVYTPELIWSDGVLKCPHCGHVEFSQFNQIISDYNKKPTTDNKKKKIC